MQTPPKTYLNCDLTTEEQNRIIYVKLCDEQGIVRRSLDRNRL